MPQGESGRTMRKIRLQRSGDEKLASRFAADLNQAQHEAVTAPDGFNLILAGPGSGKTRVITYRVAYLIAKGVPAESILLVTFTRRAAREMVGRLEALIGPKAAKIWAGDGSITSAIASCGGRLRFLATARTSRSSTARTRTTWSRWRWRTPGWSAPARWPPSRRPSSTCSASRSTSTGPLGDLVRERHPRLARMAPQPRRRRRGVPQAEARRELHGLRRPPGPLGEAARRLPRANAGLRRRCSATSWSTRCRTPTRSRPAWSRRSLAKGPATLTAVGDDAQSIYKFRGADYDNILRFPDRNPGARVFRLEDQLPVDARDRRVHQCVDRQEWPGLRQDSDLGPAERRPPSGRADGGCL